MSEARELDTMFSDVIEEMAEEPIDVSAPETYITNDSIAEWTIRNINAEKAECDRLVRLADESIAYYTDIKAEIRRKSELKIGNWLFHLRQFFGTVQHKKLKASEQYTLPSGKLSLKYGTTKQRYVDADGNEDKGESLIKWLKANGYSQFVKVKEDVAWADLKKAITARDGGYYMTDTGEDIEGIQSYLTDDEFEVR